MKYFSSPLCRLLPVCLALGSGAASRLSADVTIRYQIEVKPAAGLPAAFKNGMHALPSSLPSTLIRVKGHMGYFNDGNHAAILDFEKQTYTLIDNGHKTFATLPASEFLDKIGSAVPEMPQQQAQIVKQFAAGAKAKVESRITGRTDTIQGAQAEEREVTMTLELPLPPDIPESSRAVRLTASIWTATPEATLRNPAIRQYTGLRLWQENFLSPTGMIEKILNKAPGVGDLMAPLFAELAKNQSLVLRLHMNVYVPILAMLSQKMAEQSGQTSPPIDPDAAVLEMNEEIAELSDAPVDAALFEIPKDFSAAPADDLIRAMTQPATPAKASAPDSPEAQRIRVNGDVAAARLVHHTTPVYPPEAKAAGISGHVILNATIGTDGKVEKLTLVSGHPLLVQPAKDAVMQWVYDPLLLNGKPVKVLTQIDVNFALPE